MSRCEVPSRADWLASRTNPEAGTVTTHVRLGSDSSIGPVSGWPAARDASINASPASSHPRQARRRLTLVANSGDRERLAVVERGQVQLELGVLHGIGGQHVGAE